MQANWVIPRSVLLLVCVVTIVILPGTLSAETLERASVIEQRNAMHRLHTAVRVGDKDAIVSLLDSGFNVNESEAMRLAILMQRQDIVDVLIEHGADINRAGMSGEPPVITALRHDRVEMMKHLISKGADVNGLDLQGQTVLHYAKTRGGPVVIKYLKGNGAFEAPAGESAD